MTRYWRKISSTVTMDVKEQRKTFTYLKLKLTSSETSKNGKKEAMNGSEKQKYVKMKCSHRRCVETVNSKYTGIGNEIKEKLKFDAAMERLGLKAFIDNDGTLSDNRVTEKKWYRRSKAVKGEPQAAVLNLLKSDKLFILVCPLLYTMRHKM